MSVVGGARRVVGGWASSIDRMRANRAATAGPGVEGGNANLYCCHAATQAGGQCRNTRLCQALPENVHSLLHSSRVQASIPGKVQRPRSAFERPACLPPASRLPPVCLTFASHLPTHPSHHPTHPICRHSQPTPSASHRWSRRRVAGCCGRRCRAPQSPTTRTPSLRCRPPPWAARVGVGSRVGWAAPP